MRLIDADRLTSPEMLRMCYHLPNGDTAMPISDIEHAPTVDAVPVKHGRWIHCKGKSSIWYCSVCAEKIIYNPTRKTYKPDKKPVGEINKYCRNCGALMKAGGEDEST